MNHKMKERKKKREKKKMHPSINNSTAEFRRRKISAPVLKESHKILSAGVFLR